MIQSKKHVTISTGRGFDISPLTAQEYRAVLDAYGPYCEEPTGQNVVRLSNAVSDACYGSICRAGTSITLEEFEYDLLVPEMNELFTEVMKLTGQIPPASSILSPRFVN